MSRVLSVLAGLLLVGGGLAVPMLAAPPAAQAATGANDVVANLWMWPWNSVAAECSNVLGPGGYGAVQVAPPEDSISVAGHPWWDIYQPAAYDLNSRMGTRAQFTAMVSTCHAAGVKVYADTVINHMTGANQASTTSYGGAAFTNNYSYPSAGYSSSDFHFYPADCPQSDNQIHDYTNSAEVWNCQLVGLSDLKTGTDYVRTKIAGYLNDLIAVGVDGFRVDAAKHIPPADLTAIKGKLTNQGVYLAQEVMPGGSGSLAPAAYEGIGGVLEFTYGTSLKAQFTGSIANLQTFGPSWGLEPSAKSTVFVSNHDTERNGSTLSYKNGSTDTLANVFMLAWNFGTPNVMSSFTFSNNDASPPADELGYVTAVACGSGWECQHRQRAVKNMVGFHNATRASTTVGNWWSDGANAIAFSRGTSGWISINNATSALGSRTFTTGLPAGTYCDVVHGDFNAAAASCSGPTVTVNAAGQATLGVGAKDAVALHVNARVTGSQPTSVAVTFNENATTSWGQNVFVVGSIPALGSWNTGSSIALSSAGYPVWSGTVTLPANTYVEYKFIKKNPDGSVTWESGANRTLTTGTSGQTVNTSWK